MTRFAGAAQQWPKVIGAALLLLVGLAPDWSREAAAHDLFAAYIQHRIHLTVGAKYVDVAVELTFFEDWSWLERQAMDADHNGRISRAELESYQKRLAVVAAEQVTLRLAGREISLAPLYEPEVDLLGNDQTGPAQHRLRLFFFAPRPAALRAGDELVIEDSLWPKAKALGTLEAEGRDGCVLEAQKAGDPAFAPTLFGEARRFKAKCVKPPRGRESRERGSAAAERFKPPVSVRTAPQIRNPKAEIRGRSEGGNPNVQNTRASDNLGT
jgi:hypothetical protein